MKKEEEAAGAKRDVAVAERRWRGRKIDTVELQGKGALVQLRSELSEKNGLRANETATVTKVHDDGYIELKRNHDSKEISEYFNPTDLLAKNVFDQWLPLPKSPDIKLLGPRFTIERGGKKVAEDLREKRNRDEADKAERRKATRSGWRRETRAHTINVYNSNLDLIKELVNKLVYPDNSKVPIGGVKKELMLNPDFTKLRIIGMPLLIFQHKGKPITSEPVPSGGYKKRSLRRKSSKRKTKKKRKGRKTRTRRRR